MSDFRECPFDRSHLVVAKSFSRHLVKCQRQNPEIKLVRCSLNTSHLVKEEDLKQHLKDCPSRVYLEVYKFNVSTSTSQQEDTPETLIYHTDGSDNKGKIPSASNENTLQNDTECWDEFTYEAYDPLENCKVKRDENGAFIVPNANKFVGKSADAALMKNGVQQTIAIESPLMQTPKPVPERERTPEAGYEFGDYDRNLEQFGLSRNELHRRDSEERAIRRQEQLLGRDSESNPSHSGRWNRDDGSRCKMSLGPFFRSPFTDLTASMVNFQQYDKCGELEMASIDCLEAYGTVRGATKCADLLADFQECAFMTKQIARFKAMRMERHRQGWNGERKGDGYYAPPPRVDAY
uniref:CHHC U11-48K-type domain-containing protein n=1 Tax=Anopheles farauti TaxID=69004 RepID=A0A182R0K2_9DIPT